MAFNVKLLGVRGSLPTPHTPEQVQRKLRRGIRDFLEAGYKDASQIETFMNQYPQAISGGFGGNTICVDVQSESSCLLIDGGSGIRKKAEELMTGPCAQGKGEAHILMTHFHWDHLIGFPFFTPLFIPGNDIHLYAVQEDLEEVFKSLFKKPYFPVPFEALASNIHFHKIEARKSIEVNGFHVTPYQLDHPDPCWGYRIEHEGKVYSHCVDTEFTRATRDEMGPDLPLYQNVDLMLFDAQYTIKETAEKVNWGHGAANYGLDLAHREKIGEILFVHHDPAASDEKIRETESGVKTYYQKLLKQLESEGKKAEPVKWTYAIEDMNIEVKKR